ncbi:hypothetical protein AAFF_G00146670 [Aldrovandia affinis]|uniref:Uncharacterized protein n=1 Tax=Aldrovandia affinis TaxID=143900 RepID=A0AAD7W9Q1_9TELE|nr:hypothetical protein AAFF_G00146670 [Aldrovandia affinis]
MAMNRPLSSSDERGSITDTAQGTDSAHFCTASEARRDSAVPNPSLRDTPDLFGDAGQRSEVRLMGARRDGTGQRCGAVVGTRNRRIRFRSRS